MNNAQLPDANEELKSLVDSLASESESYPELEQEARLALANSHYYMTWLKRREGLSRDEWEPNVLAAQQNLRLLADSARRDNRSSDLERYQKDLEATVRLARLDLGELQGLPLPSQ